MANQESKCLLECLCKLAYSLFIHVKIPPKMSDFIRQRLFSHGTATILFLDNDKRFKDKLYLAKAKVLSKPLMLSSDLRIKTA